LFKSAADDSSHYNVMIFWHCDVWDGKLLWTS